MGNESEGHYLLPRSQNLRMDDDGLEGHYVLPTDKDSKRRRLLTVVCLIQSIALLSLILHVWRYQSGCSIGGGFVERSLLYSPAQEAIAHEVKTFTAGLELTGKTKYQGLSPEVDQAWGDLYNHTIMKIPKTEAALLPNRTYPIADDEGYYIAALDVFHQLHCLNLVRKALDKDYYKDDIHLSDEHVYHCVDSVRQSLMCSADVAVNVWQWDKSIKHVVGRSTVAHSCRNFEKLRQWAYERRIHKFIDSDLLVEDDLKFPHENY